MFEAVHKVWEWTKKNLPTEETSKMLFVIDNERRTAWHLAAERGHLETLQKVWDWAKENLTTEEINNKLLLATDNT
jgi:endo-1,4-beta-D-glucanase Y